MSLARGGHGEARGAGGQVLLGLQPSHWGLAGTFCGSPKEAAAPSQGAFHDRALKAVIC